MHARIPTLLAASLAALLIAVISMPARAEGAAEPRVTRTEPLPKRLDGVRVDEHLGDSIPLDLGFVDEEGKPVTLRDYFDGKVPVIITLNYSDCPMLCSLQLSGVVDSSAGKEYRLVTVSINPKEGPERARKTKARYLQQYGRPGAEDGWHFLTGSANNVHALANAIGFRYSYNEKRDEWVHPAAITVTAPNGKIARYLYGIEYHPKTLRLSLVEASEGKIGTTIDKLVLYCFHYDATEGRYAPVARNIMRLGGAIAVVVLGGFLSLLWAREAKKKRLSLQGSHT